MPHFSYGPRIKARVMLLLETLLTFVDDNLDKFSNHEIKYSWTNENTLRVRTKLQALQELIQQYEFGYLSKEQIREVLLRLKDLNILSDERILTSGSAIWDFTLRLWSKDKFRNLNEFEQTWESRRRAKAYTQSTPNQFTKGYALLIGIGETAYRSLSLPVTVNDIRALRAILADPRYCAYPEDRVVLLHDNLATGKAILEELEYLKNNTEPESTVIVYFSGHGFLDISQNRYYLIPYDVNPMDILASSLAADAFIEIFRQIRGNLLLIIDSCHAGQIVQPLKSDVEMPSNIVEMAPPESLIADFKRGEVEGLVVFTSSQGSQKSWIRQDLKMSVYSYHLIEALLGTVNNPNDKVVGIFDLMKHLHKKVRESSLEFGGEREQTPRFYLDGGDFDVGLLWGGKGITTSNSEQEREKIISDARDAIIEWVQTEKDLTIPYPTDRRSQQSSPESENENSAISQEPPQDNDLLVGTPHTIHIPNSIYISEQLNTPDPGTETIEEDTTIIPEEDTTITSDVPNSNIPTILNNYSSQIEAANTTESTEATAEQLNTPDSGTETIEEDTTIIPEEDTTITSDVPDSNIPTTLNNYSSQIEAANTTESTEATAILSQLQPKKKENTDATPIANTFVSEENSVPKYEENQSSDNIRVNTSDLELTNVNDFNKENTSISHNYIDTNPQSIHNESSTIQLLYELPPPTNKVRVEVYPTTVTLKYGDSYYHSPNEIRIKPLQQAYFNSVEEYGSLLFDFIINNKTTSTDSDSTLQGYLTALEATHRKLHFELFLDPKCIHLHTHKWEYLKYCNHSTPLAVYESSPFYRRLGDRDINPIVAQPLKILVAICNPIFLGELGNKITERLHPLDIAQEREIIKIALDRLEKVGLAEYKILDGENGIPVTWENLQKELRSGYHILHIVAHGVFFDKKYYLLMEGENLIDDFDDELSEDYSPVSEEQRGYVSAEKFVAPTFGDRLRLVILAACQSAKFGFRQNMVSGLGPHLVKEGVPAVIAMQDNMPIDTAQLFTQYFYDHLARSGYVDMAMAATRFDLYRRPEGQDSGDWGIPVLFLSSKDGKLFEIDREKLKRLEKLIPNVKDYNELPGQGDPKPQVLAQALEVTAREYGASPELINQLQTLVPGISPNIPIQNESEQLALEQVCDMLTKSLKHKVKVKARELKRFIEKNSGLQLPDSFYERVSSALNCGQHVILIGSPGTGKTSIAHDICKYAQQQSFATGTTFTTATADWTTFDTMGGLVPTSQQLLQFRPGIFLQAIRQGQWLVIDEINRAEIDKAFGELFTVLSGRQVDLPHLLDGYQVRILPPASQDLQAWFPKDKRRYDYIIHPNWRIIGTMNVLDKSFLFAMSFAFMRRFAFVDVDVPQESIYEQLIANWIRKYKLQDAENITTLKQKLVELLKFKAENPVETPLMSRRTIGPAIVKDMISYIGDRYEQNYPAKETNLIDLLGEAFALYITPQLDGLDQEGILAIYEHITELFQSASTQVLDSILTRIRLVYPYIQDWKVVARPSNTRQE